ncbi:hypothetical protein LCGC14_0942040 [marine sediment metagenome]|uniref:Uncharacterized protein n=1 Tax=marine sediment metagenome TaxID=412755 RepID=A0A0F9NJX2_9ZZZZ
MRQSEKLLIVTGIVALIAIAIALSFVPSAKERREARTDVIRAPVISNFTVVADMIPWNKVIRIHDDEKNVTCWLVERNGTAIDCIPDFQLPR